MSQQYRFVLILFLFKSLYLIYFFLFITPFKCVILIFILVKIIKVYVDLHICTLYRSRFIQIKLDALFLKPSGAAVIYFEFF